MKKILLLSLLVQLTFLSQSQVTVDNLLTEHLHNPIGLDITQPRFSWQLHSDGRNVRQAAYEVRIGTRADLLSKSTGLIWASEKVSSDASVNVMYAGSALQSGQKYYWQVRVWDNGGHTSPWSEPAFFQMALLKKSDWKAMWIMPGYAEDSVMRPSPLFRKQFSTSKKIASATAYITAHGLYEAQINGKRIGDAYLTPGWTSYHKRLQYQVYDVTDLLNTGA